VTEDPLLPALRRVLSDPPEPDPDRVDALRTAALALPPAVPVTPTSPRHRALAAVAASVLLLGTGAALGAAVDRPPGTVEFEVDLVADGGGEAAVEGRLVEFGRVVRLSSDDLPVLPTGQFYEVWFVAGPEQVGGPPRISAGTFHPDDAGHTDVSLFAAVDPRLYPTVEVTAEPGRGGEVVLGGQVALR